MDTENKGSNLGRQTQKEDATLMKENINKTMNSESLS